MLGGMGGNMQQQLAGLMGMQGMGMQGMVSCSICPNLVTVLNHGHSQGGMGGGMPMNNSQLSSMWGGMPGRSMQMGGRGMMEVSFVYFEEKGIILTLQIKMSRDQFCLVKTRNKCCILQNHMVLSQIYFIGFQS